MNPFHPVAEILSARQKPVKVFFRNDDGGWADERLQALAHAFIALDIPLDVAVIPQELSGGSVEVISALLEASDKISIHQHGFTHVNHQVSGRSCEFGSDRSYEQQYEDIASGRERLVSSFGSQVDSVFTPPWNRCTDDTVAALKSLDMKFLSRITGSTPLDSALPELPVAVDWLKKRKGERLDTVQLVDYICGRIDTEDEFIGIMLHHEHMDQENHLLLQRLIETFRESPLVSFHSMMEVTRQ